MLFCWIISNVVIIFTVLTICCVFAFPVGAGVDVAGLVVDGALEPPELVGDALAPESAGVVSGVEAGCAVDVGEAVTVLVTAATGEDAALVVGLDVIQPGARAETRRVPVRRAEEALRRNG